MNIKTLVAINLYPNFVACLANFFLDTKVVITERNAPAFLQVSWRTRLLKKILYWNANQYVFQTEEARDYYGKKMRENSVIIQNPVKCDLPYKSQSNEEKEIVAIGRLESQKNYHCLLKAFSLVQKEHSEYKLVIYGQGSLKDELLSLCESLRVSDSVEFRGFRFDVHEKIKNAQIYVLSSNFEGMPNSLMEAMAMGFPVISADCPVGGPGALICHGINGLLFPVGDYIRLAELIHELIVDEQLRKTLSNNAKRIRETNSIEAITKQWKNEVFCRNG